MTNFPWFFRFKFESRGSTRPALGVFGVFVGGLVGTGVVCGTVSGFGPGPRLSGVFSSTLF
jgi:hypothetical protein